MQTNKHKRKEQLKQEPPQANEPTKKAKQTNQKQSKPSTGKGKGERYNGTQTSKQANKQTSPQAKKGANEERDEQTRQAM